MSWSTGALPGSSTSRTCRCSRCSVRRPKASDAWIYPSREAKSGAPGCPQNVSSFPPNGAPDQKARPNPHEPRVPGPAQQTPGPVGQRRGGKQFALVRVPSCNSFQPSTIRARRVLQDQPLRPLRPALRRASRNACRNACEIRLSNTTTMPVSVRVRINRPTPCRNFSTPRE